MVRGERTQFSVRRRLFILRLHLWLENAKATLRRLGRNKAAVAGAPVVTAIVMAAVFAPSFSLA